MTLCEMTNRNAQQGLRQRVTSTDFLLALIFMYKSCLNWDWNCKSTTWVMKTNRLRPLLWINSQSHPFQKKDHPVYPIICYRNNTLLSEAFRTEF